jgi:hypothetical protein
MLTGTQSAGLGVQRAKRAWLSSVLGRLVKPNTRSTECTIREVYYFRPPERDATVRSPALNELLAPSIANAEG